MSTRRLSVSVKERPTVASTNAISYSDRLRALQSYIPKKCASIGAVGPNGYEPLTNATIKGAIKELLKDDPTGAQGVHPRFGPIAKWDVSNVTDMTTIFIGAKSFNGDLSRWDVSNVESMMNTFVYAYEFTGNISDWDVSKVKSMHGMFSIAKSFNGDLSRWDVSNVTNMHSMFKGATSFNGDLSRWDVSKAENIGSMFSDATSFNGDLSHWDVSKVKDMSSMFKYAARFDSDLSHWDVSNVWNMSDMFEGAASFDSDLSHWDVSNVTNMSGMFSDATSFNGDLSHWDVSIRDAVTVAESYHKFANVDFMKKNLEEQEDFMRNLAKENDIDISNLQQIGSEEFQARWAQLEKIMYDSAPDTFPGKSVGKPMPELPPLPPLPELPPLPPLPKPPSDEEKRRALRGEAAEKRAEKDKVFRRLAESLDAHPSAVRVAVN